MIIDSKERRKVASFLLSKGNFNQNESIWWLKLLHRYIIRWDNSGVGCGNNINFANGLFLIMQRRTIIIEKRSHKEISLQVRIIFCKYLTNSSYFFVNIHKVFMAWLNASIYSRIGPKHWIKLKLLYCSIQMRSTYGWS